MTVGTLIEELQELDPNSIIVMSSDAEGNSYSPLAGLDATYLYVPDCTWSGEIKNEEDAEDYPFAVPCVVIWPRN